ncbi:hypothetical protein ACFQW6_13780 [Nocardioides sp. GCM10028917]
MTDQMSAIKGILSAALSDLTPEQLAALTMEPFKELREDAVRTAA